MTLLTSAACAAVALDVGRAALHTTFSGSTKRMVATVREWSTAQEGHTTSVTHMMHFRQHVGDPTARVSCTIRFKPEHRENHTTTRLTLTRQNQWSNLSTVLGDAAPCLDGVTKVAFSDAT
jgi:hypothetical protein